ncbi:septal ring lytic transglycosylase RlpA family protein [Luteimonas arsenica]|uniref:septal ring lytic transglycosylase RlpA family protein n=1 Tax=Luteimonas arsenica TaxID=1586242 RepID=UPI0010541E31|nr:septal ring lytic transglycosylase RlpA family protein [Luteimonas arsenica]
MSVRRAKSACWAVAAVVVLLAGCAGSPKRDDAPATATGPAAGTAPRGDGPKVSPYAPAQEDPSTRGDYVAGGLYKPGVADTTPDYIPDVDAIPEPEVVDLPRSRYGNGPIYTVLGKRYRVLDDTRGFVETGTASYYGQKFHGRRTSNQEVYDMYAFTAAHKSLPLPSFARVTNLDTGQSVVVRVNDRGPFHEGRVVDLSYAAAVKIGVHPRGTARVEVRALSPGEDARHRPADTRTAAAVDPATGLPPGVRVATGKPQAMPPSGMDGLVAGLPASGQAVATAAPAAAPVAAAAMSQAVALRADTPQAAPASTSAAGSAPASGAAPAPAGASSGDWRFDMHQDGRAMTADEFDAWMKSRRARVATGRAGTPDPRDPALAAASNAAPQAAATAPMPAASTPAPAPAAAAPVVAVAAPASVPAPTAGGILLQVAAFGSRNNAERALSMLRGAGIADARLQGGTSAGKPVWRLRVGPVAPALVQELSARVAGLGFGAPHPVRE